MNECVNNESGREVEVGEDFRQRQVECECVRGAEEKAEHEEEEEEEEIEVDIDMENDASGWVNVLACNLFVWRNVREERDVDERKDMMGNAEMRKSE